MIMKKTYFSPVTRSIDLSHESDILDLSQAGIYDGPSDPTVPGPDEVMTRRGGIWNSWSEDDK